jgi:hypothetical protein
MSKVTPVSIINLTQMSDLTRITQPFLTQVAQALGNGLNFQDNIKSSAVPVMFSAVANQNLQVAHGLGTTPIGYLAIQKSATCDIYNGNSLVLGASFVNLKCTVAGITATILFF